MLFFFLLDAAPFICLIMGLSLMCSPKQHKGTVRQAKMRQLRDSKIAVELRIDKEDMSIILETAGIGIPVCVEVKKKVKARELSL